MCCISFLSIDIHMNDLLILCSHLQLLWTYGSNLSAEDQNIKWRSIKFLIMILRMVEELQINWRKLMSNRLGQFCPLLISICKNFTVSLLPIMVNENICLSSSTNFIEVSIEYRQLDISEKKNHYGYYCRRNLWCLPNWCVPFCCQ